MHFEMTHTFTKDSQLLDNLVDSWIMPNKLLSIQFYFLFEPQMISFPSKHFYLEAHVHGLLYFHIEYKQYNLLSSMI